MKRLFAGLVFLGIVLSACRSQTEDGSRLDPEAVVELYYMSLATEDYATMYALLSDGFKDIDLYAATEETFTSYMAGFYEGATGVRVVSVDEVSHDEKEAVVAYSILILGKTGEVPFSSSYTLKKQEDGWKLIHPYGENIDTS